MWPKNKAVRVESLKRLRDWWYEEDWRERGKDKLLKLINTIIELYETEPFITQSIDFMIDNLLLNGTTRMGSLNRPCGIQEVNAKSIISFMGGGHDSI